jgi:hypothetical protein
MKFVLFYFVFSNHVSQTDSLFMFRKPEEHKINVKALQYHQPKVQNGFVGYSTNKVKITFSAGTYATTNVMLPTGLHYAELNPNSEAITAKIADIFHDVDQDPLAIVKYDLRSKFYLNKRLRLLLRSQVLGPNKSMHTCGLILKF